MVHNLPGYFNIPYADPPYTITLHRNGRAVLFTDRVGESFKIVDGKKEEAALALLEMVLREGSRYVNVEGKQFKHREGAINFIFFGHKLVDIEPHYNEEAYKDEPNLIEKRPLVFEVIEMMKSAMKLAVFM